MVDSNKTLRFNRTYRDATGMDFQDADRDALDKLIAWVIAIGLAFLVGMALGTQL